MMADVLVFPTSGEGRGGKMIVFQSDVLGNSMPWKNVCFKYEDEVVCVLLITFVG